MAARPLVSSSSSRRAMASEPTEVGPFRLLNEVGKGSFAMVYKGVHKERGSIVAIKSVNLSKLSRKLRDNLEAEIKILRSVHHPHVVALIDCFKEDLYIHIVTEFCELGDLSQFIKGRATLHKHVATADMMRKYPNPPVGGLNEVIVRHFIKQMVCALEFLRDNSYVHRDIKPQNLLLVPSPLWYAKHKPDQVPMTASKGSFLPAVGLESLPVLKVADFGFARVLPKTSMAETLCGSPLYMAPEILSYQRYDAKADLWSVGTVIYEMVAGKPPFRANNHVELLKRIQRSNDEIRYSSGIEVSPALDDLIRGLLKSSATQRMSFERLFEHPVIVDDIPNLVGEDAIQTSRTSSISSLQRQPSSASREVPDRFRSETPASGQRPSSSQKTVRPPSTAVAASTSRPSSREERFVTPPGSARVTQTPEKQERRPTVPARASAPAAAQHTPQEPRDRTPVAAAMLMERRNSRASPTASVLKEHLDRERNPKGAEDRAAREAREREKAAQEVAFERDYVMIEKRQVEINALADELNHSPHLVRDPHGDLRKRQPVVLRRATIQGQPTPSDANPSRAIAIASKPNADNQQVISYERRYGPSPGSASSAISKALNMANIRLHNLGMGFSPPGRLSPPKGYAGFPTYPTAAQGSLVVVGDAGRVPSETKDEDTKIVLFVEELATRSDVVYGFAEVKYRQLIPAPPSDARGLGLGFGGEGKGEEKEGEDDGFTVEIIITLCEEALVLYIKALEMLERVHDIAGGWWERKKQVEQALHTDLTGSRAGLSPVAQAMFRRINNVIQWARSRYNECGEKADFVMRKLTDAQRRLPLDHPGHPGNHGSASGDGSAAGAATSGVVASMERVFLSTGVTAEKIMYERAHEMCQQAAVNDLMNQDLEGCDVCYMTAIRMLEVVLEVSDSEAVATAILGIEREDRSSIEKVLEYAKSRHKNLRRKLEAQKQQRAAAERDSKRTSLTATPMQRQRSGGSSKRDSPAASPRLSTPPLGRIATPPQHPRSLASPKH